MTAIIAWQEREIDKLKSQLAEAMRANAALGRERNRLLEFYIAVDAARTTIKAKAQEDDSDA